MVEALIPRDQDRVEHHLFGDGIAYLYCAPGGLARLVSQFDGRKSGPMQTVTPGAPSQDHDEIAGSRLTRVRVARRNAHASAIDQRIGYVAGVKNDGTIDRGNAHLVAIVLDARYHPVVDAPRMQNTRRKLPHLDTQGAETEYVGIGDGACGDPHDVAHHAANARVGATKRLQRGRMVVSLHLEGDLVILGKVDDARVVHKGRTDPWRIDLLRRRLDVRSEKAVDALSHDAPARCLSILYDALEGLVYAVL